MLYSRLSLRTLAPPSVAAALLLACLFASTAIAQAPPASSAAPTATDQPGQSISDQKLDAVAAALQDVAGLAENYQQRVDAAAESDKQGIVDEANHALEKAVTDRGLSVEEYTRILVIAKNDSQVRAKILQRLPQSGNPSAK